MKIYSKIFAGIILLSFCSISITAQEKDSSLWTLEKCINYALENNIQIKQQKIIEQYSINNVQQSKYGLIPSLNASSSYHIGFGRYLDQVSNSYVDQTTQGINGGVSSDVTLFQGFVKQNNIKLETQNLLANQQLVKQTENNISLLITSSFLQILFDKELLYVAKEQFNLTKQQVDRAQKLVDAGSESLGSLLEIKAQLSKEALNITNQENHLSMSLLNLEQFLDIKADTTFDIIAPFIQDVPIIQTNSASSIFQQAENVMPQIKRSEYEMEASKYNLKIAKGYLYPSVGLNASWNTQASKVKGVYDWDLSNSLKNNANSYIGLSLYIPIFNGLQTKTRIKNAKLEMMSAQYNLDNEKLVLRKEIEQAKADAIAAQKKFISGKEAVASYEESFRYTEQKFNVGLVNSVEYNTAKNEYTKAQSDLLQAKYEYVLRTKILDFYMGNPIAL